MYYRHTVLKISLPFTSPLKDLHRTQQEPYEDMQAYADVELCKKVDFVAVELENYRRGL